MKREKQIKLIALALALTIAIACTIMILGIQVGFNQTDTGAKITAPIIAVGLVAILFVFKLIKRQNHTSLMTNYAKDKGKKVGPYFTIGFAYFDYMLLCGILSVVCGILSGVLANIHNTMVFETLMNWSYTLGRMAIVFAVYILCFLIYTIGSMIAYAVNSKTKTEEVKEDEGV